MSKQGKKRKQWIESGKKDHITYYMIKNCKPIKPKIRENVKED